MASTSTQKFETELMDYLLVGAKQRNAPGGRYYRLAQHEETVEAFQVAMVQYFFHTLAFTNAQRYLYARCTEPQMRAEIAEGLYEEETGGITGTGPHIELYYQLAEAFDLPREKLQKEAKLLPEMAGIVHWYYFAGTTMPVLEALAVLNFAAEGQNFNMDDYQGSAAVTLDALKNHFKKSGDALTFSDVHSYADQDHCMIGARNIARLADTEEQKERIRTAIEMTFEIWKGNAAMADNKLEDCWTNRSNSIYYL